MLLHGFITCMERVTYRIREFIEVDFFSASLVVDCFLENAAEVLRFSESLPIEVSDLV